MKRSIITTVTVGLLAFVTMAGRAQSQSPNQSAESQAAQLQQISAELRRLRLEVIQQAIELQNWKIKRLEQKLHSIQSHRRRLSEQEQAINQLNAEFNNHVGPVQETVEEIEAIKAAYTEKGLKELSIKRQRIAQRETELSERLEQERQRLQELVERGKQLRVEVGVGGGNFNFSR